MPIARAPKPRRVIRLFATMATFAAALAAGLAMAAPPAAASVSVTETSVYTDETYPVTNSGTWSSPFTSQGSATTITANVGSVTQTDAISGISGTWSWSYRPDDGLIQYPLSQRPPHQTVTITARHSYFGESSTSSTTFRLYVFNKPPTATFDAPSGVVAGDPIDLSLTEAADPSSADTAAGFEYAFDCGDGSGFGDFGTAGTASCPTDVPGTRTVKGKVRDKDGGVTEYTDTVSVLPALRIADAPRVKEKTTTARFVVSLSAASGQSVTVSYATANGTAKAPADYAATTGTLTFAPDETTQTVAVPIKGDRRKERNEAFFVNLSGPTNATIADAQGRATIVDND